MKKPNVKMLPKSKFNDWILNDIDNYKFRYNVYYGGGGSGKSFGAVQKMIFKCLGNKRKVLVIRKVQRTIKDSIFTLYKNILNQIGIPYKESLSDLSITLYHNGTVFLFKGLDDPEKIKSITDITDVMIEEATELTIDDFTQLDIRLRPPKDKPFPQIFLMFNPVSKANWCYKHWFEHKEPRANIIHTNYLDNKFLTDDYINTLEELRKTNPTYYKVYCLGEFATLDKLVFPYVEKKLLNQAELQHLDFFCGMDFGYVNDTTAIIWGYYDKVNSIIYITGEYGDTGMTNDKIAQSLKDLGLGKEVIISDCAEMKSIQEIKNYGIPRITACKKGKGSIINGIDNLQRNKIIVDERCTKIIEEFENYAWVKDRKTGEYTNTPIDQYNHFIDALRYGTQKVLKNKAKFGWK